MTRQGSSRSADLPADSSSSSSTPVPPTYEGMRALSLSSAAARRQSALEAIGLRKRPDIDIVLEGKPDIIQSYSTFDEINGVVNVRFDKDTIIDDMVIVFEGQTNTFVEKVATTAPTSGRTTGRHTFLKLQQPIDSETLPENRVAKADARYSVPFTFVVPDRLIPTICNHSKANDEVHKLHLQLPPSLGDHIIAGEGVSVDDMSPDMVKINYCVKAKVATRSPTGTRIDINENSTRIRVVPAREEEPPVSISEDSTDHVLRKEKGVKKGLFKLGKIGRLTAETTQPRAFHLPHVQKQSTEPIMTNATINVRFDPSSREDQPPQLSSLVSKLRVTTFYGAAPYRDIPLRTKQDNWSALHGYFPETIALSSRNLSTVTWIRHDPNGSSADLVRRESTFSTASQSSGIPEPSRDYKSGTPFYTTTVIVPMTLPTSGSRPRWFAPTFHSCIASRTYTLDLNLSYTTPSANIMSQNVQLKVPVQVSASGGTPPAQWVESEAEIAASVAEQFGIYEQRILDAAGEAMSPVYEEVPSYAAPSVPERRATEGDVAPPDYHSGLGGGRMSLRGGVPRTRTENNFVWQRRPSALRTMRDLAVLAL